MSENATIPVVRFRFNLWHVNTREKKSPLSRFSGQTAKTRPAKLYRALTHCLQVLEAQIRTKCVPSPFAMLSELDHKHVMLGIFLTGAEYAHFLSEHIEPRGERIIHTS